MVLGEGGRRVEVGVVGACVKGGVGGWGGGEGGHGGGGGGV